MSNQQDDQDNPVKCPACELPTDADNHVQCDTCGVWFHFQCAGVADSVVNVPWSCTACIAATKAWNCVACDRPDSTERMVSCTVCNQQYHVSCTGSNDPTIESLWTCAACTRPRIVSQTAVENNQGAENNRFPTEEISSEHVRYELELLRFEDKLIQSERELIARQTQLYKRQIELLSQLNGSTSSCGEPSLLQRNIPDFQPLRQSTIHSAPQERPGSQPELQSTIHSAPQERPGSQPQLQAIIQSAPHERPGSQSQVQSPMQRIPQEIPRNHVNFPSYVSINNLPQIQAPQSSLQAQNSTLQDNDIRRLLARQAIKMDLPQFHGNPSEWPVFIASFEQSTSACGFTDLENINRLQKALKGDARKLVESQLALPSHVPQIIASLKMMYGRPEIVIRAQIDKLKKDPAPKSDKLETLIQFSLAVNNLCAAIESSGMQDYYRNPLLLQELIDRLPPQTKLSWATYKSSVVDVTLRTFAEWLSHLASDISTVLPYAPSNKERKEPSKTTLNVHQESRKCPICDGSCKLVSECKKFQDARQSDRWKRVKELNLCRVCLKRHRNKCDEAKECGIDGCKKLIHKLLHSHPQAPQSSTVQLSHHSNDPILFRVLPVTIKGRKVNIETLAFFDDGSRLSLIDESLVKELKIKGEKAPLTLKWTGNTHRTESNSQILDMKIASADNCTQTYSLTVRSVKNLDLPAQALAFEELSSKFKHLRGLPVTSYKRAKPKLIIGIDHWHLAVPLNTKEGNEGDPIATRTRLGWCVCGATSKRHETVAHHFHICECQNQNEIKLDELVRNYFSIESMGVDKSANALLTREEKAAMDFMNRNTILKDGRYEVRLPWKHDAVELPSSYEMALSRLRCQEHQYKSSPGLLEKVREHILAYFDKKYFRELTKEEIKVDHPRVWYLPMFTVQNPNKPGKVRLVWDAAAKANGCSLNDNLMKGPDLTATLFGVVMRFRQGKFAITGDIQEMFHRVKIHEEDQHSQRFLWRDGDANSEPRVFVITVMTFGATSSPFQAQFVKNLNASRFEQKFPRAVKAIIDNHYVDDLMDSVDTEDEATELAQQIKSIHASGGFHIRNWRSNSTHVVRTMNESVTNTPYQFASPDDTIEKVLGLFWDTNTDTITYSLRFNKSSKEILSGSRKPTKRETLRMQMPIYDPPGYLAHYLVGIKIIQQDLWRKKLGWDEPIPDESWKRWRLWLKQLPEIEKVKIPRPYISGTTPLYQCQIDLHTFVDAGDGASAAVTYIRAESGSSTLVTLVSSKTKVAPIKVTSIPRLELIAALLGVRLTAKIKEALTVPIRRCYYWSDSTAVLHWIHSSKKLSPFVSFRVSEIHESSNPNDWFYISSKHNVADLATKWRDVTDLSMESRWFKGPSFLVEDPNVWPIRTEPVEEEVLELFVHMEHVSPIRPELFSNYKRLLRATAYVVRFMNNCKAKFRKEDSTIGVLQAYEYAQAENILFREAQKQIYSSEIETLNRHEPLTKKSQLYKLTPYINKQGVVRLQGRIDAADCDPDMKTPVLLPKRHPITQLIILNEHRKCKHMFDETVVSNLHRRFYIPNIRRCVYKARRDCMFCQIKSARPKIPIMAPLPTARVDCFSPPFTYTGIDFFGPLNVVVRRKTEKRWGVIFTCLSIRAVHLEMTSTLSTDGFLLCLRNFVNRRRQPKEIYTDRGTNFIGAEKELKNIVKEINMQRVQDETTTTTTQWKFNPPLSPHMGGAWERLIRSIKAALYTMIPPHNTPSPETLQSVLIEVEDLINSRPLTYVPLNDPDNEPLTPNNFLKLATEERIPFGPLVDNQKTLRYQWQKSQQMISRFQKKFILFYLPTLTRRTKWFDQVREIREGDVVVVVGEDRKWPKGRVQRIIKSADGHVRRAVVRTLDGTYERPVAKLALLDVVRESVDLQDSGQPVAV